MTAADVMRNVVRQMISELSSLIIKYLVLAMAKQVAGFGASTVDTTRFNNVTSGSSSWNMAPSHETFGQSIQPMATGGYTGNAPTNVVTGYVHGQEFVAHARATARNRAALEHMNATGDLPTPKVTINNNAPGVTVRAEYVGPDEVRLIAEEVVARSAPGVVAGSLGNPNSPVSKSMRANTTATRRLG